MHSFTLNDIILVILCFVLLLFELAFVIKHEIEKDI